MKTILITGGMGFLGLNTALKFMEEGYRTILCGRTQREDPRLEGKSGLWKFVPVDLVNDSQTVLEAVRQYEVEGIIHSALPGGIKLETNLQTCINLLEVCRLTKLKFVFVSSNAAYGCRTDPNPLAETDYVPVLAGSHLDEYSAMKVTCEVVTAMYHSVHGVDSVSCRVSWVYGPGATQMWYPVWFLANALAGIPTHLDKGGNFAIDYTYVKDAALGLFLAYTVRTLEHRLFNMTSGEKISARGAGETVRAIVPGARIHIGPGPMEVGLGNPKIHPVQVGSMLIKKAIKELGYTTTSLEQGLRETAEWLKKQPVIPTKPLPD
jgi:nucleoside-diphosphate-sugar epimerase